MSRRAGPDATSNDADRAFGTPEPDPSKRATRERIVNAIGSVWLFAVVGLVVVYQTIDSPALRTLIVAGIAMLILLGLVTWGVWALRFRTTVRKAVAMVLLVGVVLVSSLIPVIFLGTSDRILLLKFGAIAFLRPQSPQVACGHVRQPPPSASGIAVLERGRHPDQRRPREPVQAEIQRRLWGSPQ